MTPPLHDQPRLDHLVEMADTLAEGVAWCEATLGVTPGPGGEHPLFGTHNRLLTVESAAFPLAYLEIIAINSEAAAAGRISAGSQKRWFDMLTANSLVSSGMRMSRWVSMKLPCSRSRVKACVPRPMVSTSIVLGPYVV